jgi:DNA-binding transcriptional ArsR family regulator
VSRVHIIDTLDALRAFSDPLKLQVIEALRPEPLTASQIARKLGDKANKIYYHVTELERVGLIIPVETRQKGNLIEKYYRPAGDFFHVDTRLFEKGPEALAAFYEHVRGTLDRTAIDLRTAIDAGRVTEAEATASKRVLLRSRLNRTDAEEFTRRLDDLLKEFGRRSSPEAELPIALTILFYTERPGGEAAQGG